MNGDLNELKRYAIGFAEVYELLKYADEEYLNRIPNKFKDLINEQRDKSHISKLNPNKPFGEQELTEETMEIIAIIHFYCSYTKEEREQILKEERLSKKEYEEELRKKFDPDNIFKNNYDNNIENVEETQINRQRDLLDIKNLIWYKKIYFKILNFINRFRSCKE